MSFEQAIARSFRMNDATWARHANPWSVYTRVPLLPALVALVWFGRDWGVWFWLLFGLWGVFVWLNPRLFPAPKSTDHWASKATFGERVWMGRQALPIPDHHRRWAMGLSFASGLSLLPLIGGFLTANGWMVFAGTALSVVFKLWFCDRMVWLYDDMKEASPEYRSWLRA